METRGKNAGRQKKKKGRERDEREKKRGSKEKRIRRISKNL